MKHSLIGWFHVSETLIRIKSRIIERFNSLKKFADDKSISFYVIIVFATFKYGKGVSAGIF